MPLYRFVDTRERHVQFATTCNANSGARINRDVERRRSMDLFFLFLSLLRILITLLQFNSAYLNFSMYITVILFIYTLTFLYLIRGI